ncbi:MAG: MFS transporter [Cypionkella sp.]
MSVSAKTTLLLSGLSTFFAFGAGMAIFGPALPVYERTYGLTTATSGLLVSTLWIGCLIGVLAVYLRGAKLTPQMGLAPLALGSVVLAIAPIWPVALLGALIFGVGYGSTAALYNPRVLIAYGPTGASKLGSLNALYSLGAILAPFGFTQVGGDLRPVFWTIAAISGVTFLLAGKAGLTGLMREGATKGFRLHLPILGFALVAIGIEASLAGLGPTALIRSGLSEDAAAQLLSLFFVAALATRIALILTAHRFSDFGIFVFAMAFAALSALGAALISPAFFFPLLGVSAGLFFQGEYVTASRKMGSDPRVSPIILAVGLVGAIFSPLVYAKFMDGLGSHGFFWLVAGVAIATTLVSAGSYRSMMR